MCLPIIVERRERLKYVVQLWKGVWRHRGVLPRHGLRQWEDFASTCVADNTDNTAWAFCAMAAKNNGSRYVNKAQCSENDIMYAGSLIGRASSWYRGVG